MEISIINIKYKIQFRIGALTLKLSIVRLRYKQKLTHVHSASDENFEIYVTPKLASELAHVIDKGHGSQKLPPS